MRIRKYLSFFIRKFSDLFYDLSIFLKKQATFIYPFTSINNLDKQYFINAFKEYKTGERKHYLMQIISRGYSEKEVELLANYYGKKN